MKSPVATNYPWQRSFILNILLLYLLLFFLYNIVGIVLSMSSARRRSSLSAAATQPTILETMNFKIEIASVDEINNQARLSQPKPVLTASSSSLFRLKIYHLRDQSRAIWQTVAGSPFIRAAVGNDSLTPGNGEYRIIQNNQHFTTHQTIESFGKVSGTDNQVQFQGTIFYHAPKPPRRGRMHVDPDEPLPVLNYTLLFVETSHETLDIRVSVREVEGAHMIGYDRIILSSFVPDSEQIFGLGEQYSFWNLNGLRVPIISREQGIGRGIQPITYLLNHLPPRSPSYAGADTLATYTAIGHYITSNLNSAYLHNTELAFFDFSETNRSSIEVVSTDAHLTLFFASRPFDLINAYTSRISGRMSKLPDWAIGGNGAVIGIQGGESKVIRVIETLKAWKVKIAAVWLQDWVGMREQQMDFSFPLPFMIPGFPSRVSATLAIRSTSPQKRLWWNWEHDKKSYPNWPQFVERLRKEYQVRVLAYINPFLSDVAQGGKPTDSFKQNYFNEATKKGYLVKHWVKKDSVWELCDYIFTSGPGIRAGMIDLTNPEARDWYKNLILVNMIENGVSGWMADFAEYLPFDAIMYSNRHRGPPSDDDLSKGKMAMNSEAMTFHNLYPLEWAKLNRETVEDARKKYGRNDIVFFTRSASAKSPEFSQSFWLGDQMHTFDHLDGLESSIFAQLSSSLSGMVYTHSDIGGYTTLNVDPKVTVTIGNKTTFIHLPILERRARFVRQDTELFERWMETSSFMSTAMFRTHEGSVPDENIQVWDNEEIGRKFAFFTDLFSSLLPYKRHLMDEHSKFGYSPVRPLFLHHPNCGNSVWSMERLQFMLGPLLTIVPVTTPGLTRVNQKIVEPPVDDDDDDPLSDGEQIILSHLNSSSLSQPSSSSEDEDDDLNESWTIKARFLKNIRTTAKNMALHFVRGVLNMFNAGHELHDDAATTNGRWPDYGTRGKRRPVPSEITAPKDLPKSLHGRPFLPPGTWVHVFSGTTFEVIKPSGLYLSESVSSANISAMPGEPIVFIRTFSRDEMLEMIKRGINGEKVVDDWLYWLDRTGHANINEDFDVNSLTDYAWRKYLRLRKSLQEFLDFVATRKYPTVLITQSSVVLQE